MKPKIFKYPLSIFPATTIPNARENMTLDSALEIISNIVLWKTNHIKELQDFVSSSEKYKYCGCPICVDLKSKVEVVKDILGVVE